MKMDRATILDTAKEYVTKDRAATHGDAESNFNLIATYWGAHLDTEVSASDVAVMMTMLKLARIKGNPANSDNWIDGCGYLACGGEIAATPAPEPKTFIDELDEREREAMRKATAPEPTPEQSYMVQKCLEHMREGKTAEWLAEGGFPAGAIRTAGELA